VPFGVTLLFATHARGARNSLGSGRVEYFGLSSRLLDFDP
jgi:hypothetical protein